MMDELVRQALFRMSASLVNIVHRLDTILEQMEDAVKFGGQDNRHLDEQE